MKISIAMATYNGEKYILEQLESFINQTKLPDELVISDDNSMDKTIEIIEKFQEYAPFPIKIYKNNKNLGYTQNFNRALEHCSNELIFLSDQDDVWFDNKIEYMVKLAKEYPKKDLFMNDAELVNEKLETSNLTKLEQIKNAGFQENHFVMGCCIAVRKSYLDMILPIPDGFKGHDEWLVRLADVLELRLIDKKVLQYYRRHGENESQAVYNSLIKVKLQKVSLYEKIIAWLQFSKKDFYRGMLVHKTFFIQGVERLRKHPLYTQKTEKHLAQLQKDMEYIQQRYAILSTTQITERLHKAFLFYQSGRYGLKSFISDLIRK